MRKAGALGLLFALAPTSASAHLGDQARRAREAAAQLDPGTPGSPTLGPGGGPSPPSPEAEGEPDDRPGPVPLFPRLTLGESVGWMLAPEPNQDDTQEEESEAELEGFLDESLGQDRIDAGRADGWYYELAQSMRRDFHPDQAAVERERRDGMNPFQVLVDELSRYARGPERPIDVPGQPVGEMRAAVPRGPLGVVEAQDQDMIDRQNLLNGSVTWHRVDVRVTFSPEGEVDAAWVIRTSGSHALDEAALHAVRQGADDADLPPPERIVGDRQAIQCDWSFEMGDVATDPFQAGCVGDPGDEGGAQCAAGGRGIVRTRMRLLQIVDATSPSRPERRAARRRDERLPSP